MSKHWHFGNTTVRNPSRIRDGLICLYNSNLNGLLIGKENENRFALELSKAGVVNLVRTEEDDDLSDLGRKWRSCFSQLGFITHKFSRKLNNFENDSIIKDVLAFDSELELSGYAYEITPLGLLMINAETVPEQQECMLRALLAYQRPTIIEKDDALTSFNPFYLILQVLKKLTDTSLGLSKPEMAIVQSHWSNSNVDSIVDEILEFRKLYDEANSRVAKIKVENNLLVKLSKKSKIQSATLGTYADVNFRYVRLTGLVSYRSRRLVISDVKIDQVDAILAKGPDLISKESVTAYLARLWNGAVQLPTDNFVTVMSEIKRYVEFLKVHEIDISDIDVESNFGSIAALNQVRMKLELRYQLVLEEEYASKQGESEQLDEILAYLKELDKQSKDKNKDSDIDIVDKPSYFEWAVWRAFLAINSLINKPYESRRFKVDQDFFPLGCAPGNGPDLIFEFDSYVLVVEVTLTSSSRQEAAEGEPVRRHIAKEKMKSNKPVYGLFIARSIDNNTAETFRIGVWYNGDEPEFINIVPLKLAHFINIIEHYCMNKFDNKQFRTFLDNCLIPRNAHAPAWQREISKVVDLFVQ